MSLPAPGTQSTNTAPVNDRERFAKFMHRFSIWMLIACPAIALLPPRKLDKYTLGLGGMALVAAQHLARENTGRTILQRLGGEFDSIMQPVDQMPTERARHVQEMQRRARAEREMMLLQTGREREKQEQQIEERDQGWRAARLGEEREAITEGKGYGGLIKDQIMDVWCWDKRVAKSDNDNNSKNNNNASNLRGKD